MKPEVALKQIARAFDTQTQEKVPGVRKKVTVSTNAYYNMLGVVIDHELTGKVDKIGIKTLKRITKQLARIHTVLIKVGALSE